MPLPTFDPHPLTYLFEAEVRDGSSPVETYEPDSAGADRVLLCPWDKRFEAVTFLLGTAIVEDDRIKRLLPQQYPARPGWYATRVGRVSGTKILGTDPAYIPPPASPPPGPPPPPPPPPVTARLAKYTHAKLEVRYEHIPYAVLTDEQTTGGVGSNPEYARYTSLGEVSPAAEYLQLPGKMLKYAPDPADPPAAPGSGETAPSGVPIPFGVGKVLPICELKYVWHRIPYDAGKPGGVLWRRIFGRRRQPAVGGAPAVPEVLPYLGSVNKTAIASFDAGTLMFASFKPVLKKSPLGTGYEWDYELGWSLDPQGWNHKLFSPAGTAPANRRFHYVSASGSFYPAGGVPDGDSIYHEREFADLFKVTA